MERMPSGPGPIPYKKILEITEAAPPPVGTVLLSSETTGDALASHVARTRPAILQIVSPVDPEELLSIRRRHPALKLMPVVHVEDESAIEAAKAYEPVCDAILLDSGRPSKGELGGTGRVHNWNVSSDIVQAVERPVFLAGGLTPQNVGAAIDRVRPFAVDVCSGVRVDGALDPDLAAQFIAAVAKADGR